MYIIGKRYLSQYPARSLVVITPVVRTSSIPDDPAAALAYVALNMTV